MSHADRIARIRIQLDDWQPVIVRRLEVPLTATLKALHDIIQAAMPFDDYHLFEFRADGKRYAISAVRFRHLEGIAARLGCGFSGKALFDTVYKLAYKILP